MDLSWLPSPKLMDFALKMMDFTLKMTDSAGAFWRAPLPDIDLDLAK